jgi:acyl-coenzyme A thioesterase PaaI-like protein
MSSRRQGLLPKLSIPAGLFRQGINLWPPFVGAGIRVTRVASDFREIEVRLNLGVLNRNYFGTQFGGSVYAMTDPFFALMMLRNLGPGYLVWDKSGAIHYLKPARGDVFARFRLTAAAIERARAATAGGDRHEPTFTVSVVDAAGEKVAEVAKTLYIRRQPDVAVSAAKPPAKPARARTGKAPRKG